jgi:hypothetical protein
LHDAKGARIVGAPFRLSWNRSDRWAVYRIEALTVKAVIIMRGTLIAAIAACFAVLILAGARPALSMPATAAVHYGEMHAGVLQEVGKRYSGGPIIEVMPMGISRMAGTDPIATTIGRTLITIIPITIVGPALAFGSASEASRSS